MTSEESGLNLGLHDCQALACAPFDLGLEALKQHHKEKDVMVLTGCARPTCQGPGTVSAKLKFPHFCSYSLPLWWLQDGGQLALEVCGGECD